MDLQRFIIKVKKSELEELQQAAYLLEGYLFLKAGNPLLQRYKDSSGMGRLLWVSQRRSVWSAAAYYLLGKIYSILTEGKEIDTKWDLLKGAFDSFDAINEEVTLPRSVLLPGIRSEAPPEAIDELGVGVDPLTRRVPIPFRYRASLAGAIAEYARCVGDPEDMKKFLTLSDRECSLARNRGVDTKHVVLNVALCAAIVNLYRVLGGRRGWASTRGEFDELRATLSDSRADLPQHRYYDWLSLCWAGLACVGRKSSDRVDALYQMHACVKRSLQIRSGRNHPFGIEPLYDLAQKEDADAKKMFAEILRSYEIRQSVGVAEGSSTDQLPPDPAKVKHFMPVPLRERSSGDDSDRWEELLAIPAGESYISAMTWDTFIAFASADQAFAVWLKQELEAHGRKAFCSAVDLPGTPSWDKAIQDAQHGAHTTVVLLTLAAIASRHVNTEIQRAINWGKHVVPVPLDAAMQDWTAWPSGLSVTQAARGTAAEVAATVAARAPAPAVPDRATLYDRLVKRTEPELESFSFALGIDRAHLPGGNRTPSQLAARILDLAADDAKVAAAMRNKRWL